jgi:PPOX class probable F420-dependent enzyme
VDAERRRLSMTPEERSKFLAEHRLCIVGYARRAGPPAMTPVYYAMDGDDIVISTTRTRAKGRVLKGKPAVSVCVLGEAQPFPYLTVYGRARIEDEGAVDVMMKIGERMTGNAIPESARPAVEKRAQDEGRVVLRVTPDGYTS